MLTSQFPQGFAWGTATASYQIEGAVHEDGRGESIWDRFSHTPGKVKNNDTGDTACDHYHLYRSDIDLMKEIGITAYRLSVAWPRILPAGAGRVNQAGIGFYDRLIDTLLQANIRPFITLYHWDLPSELHDQGGWTNRDIAGWFSDYATVVVKALGDRVHDWITLNEPWCTAFLGYQTGEHAPGLRSNRLALQAVHNTLLAHGQSVRAIRAAGDSRTKVGIALNSSICMPATDSEEDQAAADEAIEPTSEWFFPPLLTGSYSQRLLDQAGIDAPVILPGDMSVIAVHNDFLGLNYYNPTRISVRDGKVQIVDKQGAEYTTMGWEVEPQGLYLRLQQLHQASKGQLPIYITENGAAFPDIPAADGLIHDDRRVEYLRGHFDAAQRAIASGVDLRGYFVWTLTDNFEWAHGYSQYFGMIKVDYATQRRQMKDSGLYFKNVIAANAVV